MGRTYGDEQTRSHSRLGRIWSRQSIWHSCLGTVGGSRRTLREAIQANGEHANSTQRGPRSESNKGPSRWDICLLTLIVPSDFAVFYVLCWLFLNVSMQNRHLGISHHASVCCIAFFHPLVFWCHEKGLKRQDSWVFLIKSAKDSSTISRDSLALFFNSRKWSLQCRKKIRGKFSALIQKKKRA